MDCITVELACRCLEREQVGHLRTSSFKSSLSFSKQQGGEQDTYVRRNRNLPNVTPTPKRGILQDRILPAVVFLLSLQVCSSFSLDGLQKLKFNRLKNDCGLHFRYGCVDVIQIYDSNISYSLSLPITTK